MYAKYSSGMSFRCKSMKNVIDFDLFWFNSNLQRNCFIELSSELGAPILDWGQNIFRFGDFLIRSFKFLDRRLVSFQSQRILCIGCFILYLKMWKEWHILSANMSDTLWSHTAFITKNLNGARVEAIERRSVKLCWFQRENAKTARIFPLLKRFM